MYSALHGNKGGLGAQVNEMVGEGDGDDADEGKRKEFQ